MRPLFASMLMVWAFAGHAAGPTADAIIAKNLAARGGLEKMRAIHTLVVTGKLETPGGGGYGAL